MRENKTTTFSNALIWFGAAVSIAEIMTGALLAPLGFKRGLAAVLLGHLIGCFLLYLAGLIGARTGLSSMNTVKLSFGGRGAGLFSFLNVVQLIGWTAVMVVSGAAACSALTGLSPVFWSLAIGGLILLWVTVRLRDLGKLNLIAMGALFLLTLLLSAVVFGGGEGAGLGIGGGPVPGSADAGIANSGGSAADAGLSFGAAVELSVAMPLSWLPLISDYTRLALRPKAAALAGGVTYFFASCWMYIIGLGAALFAGQSDIAGIMTSAGFGVAGLLIVIFSTVTTTFLDVYSAGVSAVSISPRLKEKPAAVLICLLGTALAIFTPITEYESFLYFISSVFAPMIAVQLVNEFALKKDNAGQAFHAVNLLCWLAGFLLYRLLLRADTPLGVTLPVMGCTGIITLAAGKLTANAALKKERTHS